MLNRATKISSVLVLISACMIAASCNYDLESYHEEEDVVQTADSLAEDQGALNTFISDSLEIDQLTPGTVQPQDANLFVGLDPADNSVSNAAPNSVGSFLDWDDLGGDKLKNHQLLDVDLASGKDPTSFPQSNECVNSSQVLSKMDLRYVAVANNSKYAYFAVLRSNNNGDAGYYWLFTKKAPKMTQGETPCSSGQKRLMYDVSVGDVMLAGHFHPNGSPLLKVFRAVSAQNNVTAVNAVNFNAALWSENNTALAAVAVNTTPTDPGSFGSAGVVALNSAKDLEPEVFAEAAVDLSVFTGNNNNCGAVYYGSVITRSSGAGGTSPDLKDLAGPALFNFGSVKASAKLVGSCAGKLSFEANALGMDGSQVENPLCVWSFDNGASISSQCVGELSVSPGLHVASVTVSDQNSDCSSSVVADSVNVFVPMSVDLALQAQSQTCPTMTSDAVAYAAHVTGGTGQSLVTWSDAGCSGSVCEVNPGDSDFCANSDLQATASDTMGLCPDAVSEVETLVKTTVVSASDND